VSINNHCFSGELNKKQGYVIYRTESIRQAGKVELAPGRAKPIRLSFARAMAHASFHQGLNYGET
jgi:hypothetical protein